MGLKKLVEISNFYGKNPGLVLAGGGNTSYKDENYLFIKGSGTTLADITESGFVKMNRKALADMWKKNYPQNVSEREVAVLSDLMDARSKSDYNKRPSVETSLHDLLPQRYVVHLHPALLNGLSCSVKGEKKAKEILGEEIIWIPPVEPGWILAVTIKKYIDEFTEKIGKIPAVIILANHGIFVADDSLDKIKEIYDDVFEKLSKELIETPDFSTVEFDKEKAAFIAPCLRMLLGDLEASGNDVKSIVTFNTNKALMNYITDEASFEPLSSSYSPDHIVYCKADPLFIKSVSDIQAQYDLIKSSLNEYKQKYKYNPRIIVVEKLGVFVQGSTKKNADTAMALFMDTVKIAVYTKSFGGHSFLPQALKDFIINWEVESYRQKISSDNNSKRIAEKIAIVTGAAQGFGQGVAEEMLKQGVNMVIADLNYDLAEKNSCVLCDIYGKNKAIALKTDVSNEESVKNMVYDTVLAYGGVDVIVSNAGISRPGGLEEMTQNLFELMVKINYTGYYLCAKYTSRIMKIQHMFNPNYFMDIIQVNSKSGLVGSNKNFAYAGSKFGGIGLTQSFALELVEYNIKVNSVCPGNYFDGPLWADPEKGLFKQFLDAGKAPGAKNVDDVRKFYEAKIPMKKGCQPTDIAKAILYFIEQLYETGQAMPVTGGQTMLK